MKNKSRAGIIAFLTVLGVSVVLVSDTLKLKTEESKHKKSSDDKDHSAVLEKDNNKKEDEISDIYNDAVSAEAPVTSAVTVSSVYVSKTVPVTSAVTTALSSVTVTSSAPVTTVTVTSVTEPETASPETAPPEEYREPETQPPPPPEPERDHEPEPEPEIPSAPPVEHSYPSASEYQSEVLRIVNIRRSEVGAGPLSYSDALNYCAQIRSAEVVDSFSHYRPDGSECFSVLSQNGISASAAAENIAAGSPDPASVVEQWMNSDSHRKNMLNPAYTSMGVGYTRYDGDDFVHYWVQLFIG